MRRWFRFITTCGGLTTWLSLRDIRPLKEVFDRVAGAITLVLLSPVMLACAVIIKCSDRGPVFFTQQRVGKYRKEFTVYKLRTMRLDAETQTGEVWASEKDPRILRACRWMRTAHIDELPQLLNVIKGEMSLVGPRPERAEIVVRLEEMYPDIAGRILVKPGITGLAQVRNGYDTTPEHFRHKLNADMEYIENASFIMDMRIILATLPKFYDRQAK